MSEDNRPTTDNVAQWTRSMGETHLKMGQRLNRIADSIEAAEKKYGMMPVDEATMSILLAIWEAGEAQCAGFEMMGAWHQKLREALGDREVHHDRHLFRKVALIWDEFRAEHKVPDGAAPLLELAAKAMTAQAGRG